MARVARAALLASLLLVLGLPLVHTLLVRQNPLGPLASPRLGKVVFPLEPQWTLAGWISGDFQRRADHWFSHVVEPRGWVIPLMNQLLYTLFSKSYVNAGTIVIGREAELYELTYVAAQCSDSATEDADAGAASVTSVGQLNGHLSGVGTVLVVLVTPSKAAVLPERLPAGVCAPSHDPTARRRRLVSALRAAGVAVIDGHALVATMKAEDPLPPFPRGGTHWSRVAGARVAGPVLRELARLSDVDSGGIDVRHVRWGSSPEQSDRDLADLLTLFVPPLDYRAGLPEIVCRPTLAGRARTLVTVGGSFLYQVLDPITRCGLFRQVEHYFYYDTLYQRWPDYRSERPDLATLRWQDKLATTDVVVLEIAEHLIGRAPHFDRFVADALRALRQPTFGQPIDLSR